MAGDLRATVEKAVAVLIDLLDAMDGDTDVELNGDETEPSLGARDDRGGSLWGWDGASREEADLEADHSDDEPWLASPEATRQIGWAIGCDDDREQGDEREPGGFEEYSSRADVG